MNYLNKILKVKISQEKSQFGMGCSLVFVLCSLFLTSNTNAQQGFGTSKPDKTAVIDMTATNKGFLAPRVKLTSLTDVTTIASPANALTVFNTATTTTGTDDVAPGYYYYSVAESKWVSMKGKEADLRFVDSSNHITQDAGTGGNGLSAGSGANNIGIGGNSLLNLVDGGDNTAVGIATLAQITSSQFNVALGREALHTLLEGNGNTALGTGSNTNLLKGSENISIGYNLRTAEGKDYQLNIGNWIYGDSGNIGIGTDAPNSKLTVDGAANNLKSYDAASGLTIDFSKSNMAFTMANNGNIFVLTNLKDGGTYTLAVKGMVAGTSDFTAAGFTVHLPTDNQDSIDGTHSVYTMVVIGADVYMSWITGY